jgi:hypothetical protein
MPPRRSSALATYLTAVFLVAIFASPASASVTLGQLAPGLPATCAMNNDWAQPTVTSGNTYVVPGNGTITSWSHIASASADEMMSMKIWRQVSGLNYQAVGHDGPHRLTPTALNTFPANIPVKPGDVLGEHTVTGNVGCMFNAADSVLVDLGDAQDGGLATFTPSPPGVGRRLNITAVFVPSNSFTLGTTKLNAKKATATLTLQVPNPGELSASGNGVRASSAGTAVISRSVPAGQAQLLIKAKGKKKRKLNETGKVKLNVAVTYTPTGGDANTQSVKVKLKKKL